MGVQRALPHPELRSVLRSFSEVSDDLGPAERTWPIAARPHQMLQFHMGQPYRARHADGPARLAPKTYISGPLTCPGVEIHETGRIHVFNISVSPDCTEPIDRNQYGVARQQRP